MVWLGLGQSLCSRHRGILSLRNRRMVEVSFGGAYDTRPQILSAPKRTSALPIALGKR